MGYKIKNKMSKFIAEHDSNQLFIHDKKTDYLPWILMALVILLMFFALWVNGRIWWCKWDTPVYIATFDAWSRHTSQHFFDPYAVTHLLHGFLFLWGLQIIFHKILSKNISFAWLLFLAVFAEAAWEVLENSQFIIQRYREQTASLDYFGDSIANSFGDVIACAVGFLIAYRLKFWLSLALFLTLEIILILTIRDSLLINIIMLIYPLEVIKMWQTNGQETAHILKVIFGRM
jgi:hypothetical protein